MIDSSPADEFRDAAEALSKRQRASEGRVVENYTFKQTTGSPTLESLFGVKNDLILIHNMGSQCAYCTMWADGFSGMIDHILDRSAFVLVSPESPEAVKAFAASRGWRFEVASAQDSSFTADLGMEDEDGDPMPGVSTFHQEADGTIRLICTETFGPGDPFCAPWHFFGRLKDGAEGWRPKLSY